jgi:hypothetical protein
MLVVTTGIETRPAGRDPANSSRGWSRDMVRFSFGSMGRLPQTPRLLCLPDNRPYARGASTEAAW